MHSHLARTQKVDGRWHPLSAATKSSTQFPASFPVAPLPKYFGASAHGHLYNHAKPWPGHKNLGCGRGLHNGQPSAVWVRYTGNICRCNVWAWGPDLGRKLMHHFSLGDFMGVSSYLTCSRYYARGEVALGKKRLELLLLKSVVVLVAGRQSSPELPSMRAGSFCCPQNPFQHRNGKVWPNGNKHQGDGKGGWV